VTPERTPLRPLAQRAESAVSAKCEGYSGSGAVLWRAVNLARRLVGADAGNSGVAMNGRDGMRGSQGGRFQWGSFGFFAGIMLGVLLGWFFAGFIGAFIRVAMVALVIVPVVVVYLAWRRYIAPWLRPPAERHYVGPVNAIETRAVVHRGVVDSRTR
jgi:hypothetical protein